MNEHGVGIWVLIVDDDPLVLSSLRQYFAATDDIRVVAEARDGADALARLDNVQVDVVLADIHMSTMDGVSLLREIQRCEDPPMFVAITALDNDETMLKVLAGGGAGYIVKSARPKGIVTAVRDAVAGGTTVSPQALSRLVDYLPDEKSAPSPSTLSASPLYEELTPVEKNVLEQLCQGKSNADIASALNYSEATVKKHISLLISQFNASSRLSLALRAVQMGLNKGGKSFN